MLVAHPSFRVHGFEDPHIPGLGRLPSGSSFDMSFADVAAVNEHGEAGTPSLGLRNSLLRLFPSFENDLSECTAH